MNINEYFAENPASLLIVWEVTNGGTKPVNWKCTFHAQDPSGAYRGFATFESTTPLKPGGPERHRGALIITNEGAPYVTEVTVECN